MNTQLTLGKKHDLLKNGLDENLQKKHLLELRINQQFEELKNRDFIRKMCTGNNKGGIGNGDFAVCEILLLSCYSHTFL